jgi:hypothetical protein
MPSYTKRLVVDPGGLGDHTTIAAAISAAVAGGAGTTADLWRIDIMGSVFNEDLTVPAGVHLNGWGALTTRITGTITAHSASRLSNLRVEPETDTSLFGVHAIGDTGSSVEMENVYVYVSNTTNDAVVAVKYSGAGSGTTILYIRNCYLYARNPYSGAGTSAKVVCIRVLSGTTGYVECFGTHAKTSNAPAVDGVNNAQSVFAWVQGSGAYVGVHAAASDYSAIFADAPIVLLNENATYKGGMLDVAVTTSDTAATPAITNTHANANLALYTQAFNHVDVYSLSQVFAGQKYDFVPIITATRPPISSDDAPVGALWLMVA